MTKKDRRKSMNESSCQEVGSEQVNRFLSSVKVLIHRSYSPYVIRGVKLALLLLFLDEPIAKLWEAYEESTLHQVFELAAFVFYRLKQYQTTSKISLKLRPSKTGPH